MKTTLNHLGALGLFVGLLLVERTGWAAAEFDANLQKDFPIPAGGKLTIEADRGAIAVTTDGSDQVQVRVYRKVKGGGKENADELFKNHEVTFAQDGNHLTVVAKNKKKERSWTINRPGLEVRYQISIPQKFDVDLRTAGGNITLGKLDGNAVAHTSSGSIKLSPVTGSVQARDAGGDIVIEDAGGTVAARTSSGSIEVRKAAGKVEASNAGGNIKIGESSSDVIATTSSGSIKLSHIKGNVEAKNAGGDILIESADGTVKTSTSSGSIRVNDVKGELTARNAGGGIIIGEAGSGVSAYTTSGSIRIASVKGTVDAKDAGGDIIIQEAGGKTVLSTTSGNIRVGRCKGVLSARNAGGGIEISDAQDAVIAHTSSGEIQAGFSSAPKSESRLDVSGGGIRVSLPRSAGVDLDAKASGGRVTSDLPVAMTSQGGSPRSSLQGKINSGGPALILRASSGDIRVTQTDQVEAQK